MEPGCTGGNVCIAAALARSSGCCGYCTHYMTRTASWILPSTYAGNCYSALPSLSCVHCNSLLLCANSARKLQLSAAMCCSTSLVSTRVYCIAARASVRTCCSSSLTAMMPYAQSLVRCNVVLNAVLAAALVVCKSHATCYSARWASSRVYYTSPRTSRITYAQSVVTACASVR